MSSPRPARRLSALAAGLLVLLPLAACGSSSSGGDGVDRGSADRAVSVTNCGRTVALDRPVRRAVSVNQPATELLLTLGLRDRIVGAGLGDTNVLPGLKKDLDGLNLFSEEFPSFESVVATEPDLVYATFDYTFTDEGIADRSRFAELGIDVYQSPSECTGQEAVHTKALTLDDQYAEIRDVATLFGVDKRGDELVADLKRRAATAADGLDAGDVSTAWWYSSTKTPYFAGCCGAPGIMTRAVGAENAFDDLDQLWPEVSWESVVDRDPDVFVLADLTRGSEGDTAAAKIAFLESNPATKNLTAVKKKRYIILPGTTMDPSIRNVDGIEQVAEGLRELGLGSGVH
ncbi:ABC transporter substrate-binding protein [Aeromicrobium fastidiosum]|uniref:ABC transporter substrate-binding protein n=1 Tax=Aeromicrobium fastidiosum TaxID=52699 RepID=A0A641AS01_9ACTN|nr:ABC transporter substrate-binding protein [Aeromicrobium fastidiosum]KAA1379993.1 ABC transporter substrate-binding protein [Aeromicrobium fastidiosum]MBP2389513.1 iron complex transport system substrate-binding protein [Aeromicrobium fastidiosum]